MKLSAYHIIMPKPPKKRLDQIREAICLSITSTEQGQPTPNAHKFSHQNKPDRTSLQQSDRAKPHQA